MPLDHLQGMGVLAPTVVWLSGQPTTAYWQWVQMSPAPLITVTTVVPPWPWIAVAPAAVAKFKYPTVCVAHKCPRHQYKGPLYYSLHTVGKLLAELNPALKTHLREHLGDLALLAPHGLATNPPRSWPLRLSQGSGSMTCRRWQPFVELSSRWMLGQRRREWLWQGLPSLGMGLTKPTLPPGWAPLRKERP